MIMQNSAPCRLSWRNKLGVLALTLAILPGWVIAEDEKKNESVEVEVITTDAQIDAQNEFLFAAAADVDPETAKKMAEIEKQIGELNKKLAELRGDKPKQFRVQVKPVGDQLIQREIIAQVVEQGPVPLTKIPTVKVFDKDGKELKDIKVIITNVDGGAPKIVPLGADGKKLENVLIFTAQSLNENPIRVPLKVQGIKVDSTAPTAPKLQEKPIIYRYDGAEKIQNANPSSAKPIVKARMITTTVGDGSTITLSRTSYALKKELAEQIITMFKDKATKETVLEMKYEGDKLIVTTSPEVQEVIRGVVNLMLGKPITRMNISTFSGLSGSKSSNERTIQGISADGLYKIQGNFVVPVPPVPPVAPPPPPPAPPAPPKKPAKPEKPIDIEIELGPKQAIVSR